MRTNSIIVFFAASIALSICPVASWSQMPRGISYQGFATINGQPINGTGHDVAVDYYDAQSGGSRIYSEDFGTQVQFTNGAFDVVLGFPSGSSMGFPVSIKFDRPIWMQVSIDGTAIGPRSQMWGVPYAFNAERANGIDVSPVPVNGDIFPIPLDVQGKISQSILPVLQSNGITSIIAGTGMAVSQNNGVVTLSIGPGAITGSMLAPGSITGSLLVDRTVEGAALISNITLDGLVSDIISRPAPSNQASSIVAINAESNGGSALMVKGGIGANNPTGVLDGNGLAAATPQTYWADQVIVPPITGISMTIFNTLVNASSTIILTPTYVGAGTVIPLAVGGVGAGQFIVNAPAVMGAGVGGSVSAINYLIINH